MQTRRSFDELRDERADHFVERDRVRHVLAHELVERLRGVEHHQPLGGSRLRGRSGRPLRGVGVSSSRCSGVATTSSVRRVRSRPSGKPPRYRPATSTSRTAGDGARTRRERVVVSHLPVRIRPIARSTTSSAAASNAIACDIDVLYHLPHDDPNPAGRASAPSTSRGDWSWCSWPSITCASMQACPAGGPAPAVFFTRWVTHFCAPGFVFFAGASAFLRAIDARRHRGAVALPAHARPADRAARAHGDAVRVDLQLRRDELQPRRRAVDDRLEHGRARAAWSGCPSTPSPRIGLVIVFGHNLVDPYLRDLGRAIGESPFRWFWQFLYFGGSVTLGDSGPRIAILYSLLPWIGVMAAGYAFGRVLQLADRAAQPRVPADRRRGDRAVHRAAGRSTSTAIRGRGRASNRSRSSTRRSIPRRCCSC